MKRILVFVILGACICGCGTTSSSSYLYHEVVRSPDQLQVGDSVKIKTEEGEIFQGILLRLSKEEIVVTTESQGRIRVPWIEIRSLQRSVKAEVKEE
ncbi:MAG: hypothetical protein QGG64_04740 [Candidatus Latescibacteria bacterium]|nr:hypothetical protein [Candidatus Latescibacterota bacterium]